MVGQAKSGWFPSVLFYNSYLKTLKIVSFYSHVITIWICMRFRKRIEPPGRRCQEIWKRRLTKYSCAHHRIYYQNWKLTCLSIDYINIIKKDFTSKIFNKKKNHLLGWKNRRASRWQEPHIYFLAIKQNFEVKVKKTWLECF